jgi:hypothetical protein
MVAVLKMMIFDALDWIFYVLMMINVVIVMVVVDVMNNLFRLP